MVELAWLQSQDKGLIQECIQICKPPLPVTNFGINAWIRLYHTIQPPLVWLQSPHSSYPHKKERSASSSNQTSIFVNWRPSFAVALMRRGSAHLPQPLKSATHSFVSAWNLFFRVMTPLCSSVSAIIPWADIPHHWAEGQDPFMSSNKDYRCSFNCLWICLQLDF